jgi:hypothetical protein
MNYLYNREIEALQFWLQAQGKDHMMLRPASQEALEQLSQLGVPESVRTFFALAEPSEDIGSEGVYLAPINRLVESNQNAVPGIAASRYGYIVIGDTVSGDAYCLDTNHLDSEGQPSVYLVNHETVGETATLNEVLAGSKLVAMTFKEFLTRFIAGTLPYDFYQATTSTG